MLKWTARAAGALLALALLFFGLGYWNATRTPEVVAVRLPLAGLPPGREIRVLQLSDLHFGYLDMGPARLGRIIAQANALKPDLIVLTGDYHGGKLLDKPSSRLEAALGPLAALRAPLGVFAVTGNHDQPYWTARLLRQQKRPTLLVNRAVDVGPLAVVGLQSAARGADPAVATAAMAAVPKEKPILLIRHEGDFMPYVPHPPNPVLVLAGHTHGGQVVLPLLGSIGDHWPAPPHCRRGLCRLGDWRVYVSSGLGTSVLPIRYGVPPEMVLLTLYPAGQPAGRNPSTER